MTKEKWQDIKKIIRSKFSIENEYEEDLSPGKAEVLEFNGPLGLIKARFIERPKLLDKKTNYSNRIGSDVKVGYIFSDTENVTHLELFLWSAEEDDWHKLDANSLFE